MTSSFTWPDTLTTLVRRGDLSRENAQWAMNDVLGGNASPVQIAALVVALRTKGETVEEIGAFADAMLENATPVDLPRDVVDIVGSGGDRAMTVNISTMAAILTAATGVPVVKHGNRAASSACGSADVLEALGVALDVPAARQAEVLGRAGLVFLFAPLYHPSLRHAAAARGELKISTTFNFLGPLANPARPLAQAVGVADARMAELVAGVFAARGARGLVFHGDDGLDEFTTTTTSLVWVVGEGRVVRTTFDPADLGIARAQHEDLVGGEPALNAQVARDTFAGAGRPAVADIVALNAAAALLAHRGPSLDVPLVDQLAGTLATARSAITTGAATATLDRLVEATQAARR